MSVLLHNKSIGLVPMHSPGEFIIRPELSYLALKIVDY